MHGFLEGIYTILWFFGILYMVPKIYRPQNVIASRDELRSLTDPKEAKSRLMQSDGIHYIGCLVLSFIGMICTQSWPIAGALFLLLLMPEIMFWGLWSCIWLSLRSLAITILIFALLLNIHLVHWTIHIAVSDQVIQFTIPLLNLR